MTTEEQFLSLARDQTGVEARIQDTFDQHRLDSIDVIKLVMGAEEHFGVVITDTELDHLNRFQDICDLVQEKISDGARSS